MNPTTEKLVREALLHAREALDEIYNHSGPARIASIQYYGVKHDKIIAALAALDASSATGREAVAFYHWVENSGVGGSPVDYFDEAYPQRSGLDVEYLYRQPVPSRLADSRTIPLYAHPPQAPLPELEGETPELREALETVDRVSAQVRVRHAPPIFVAATRLAAAYRSLERRLRAAEGGG